MYKKIKKIIIKTQLFNLTTAYIHQRKRRKYLLNLVHDIIDKYKVYTIEYSNQEISNYIWVCWFQGIDDMTPLIKECYKRICDFNKDKKVVLITNQNFYDYVEFPSYILEKYYSGIITKTHFSDLLRTELLKKYGGVWMDITLFTFSKIPDLFYTFPIFTGKFKYNYKDYNVSKNRWTSYFWVSRYSNNILFLYMSDFWKKYWKTHNQLIEYFLIDYVIELGYRSIKSIKKELDMIPMNACGENVWVLLKKLSDQYDDSLLKDLKEHNWMQKLSYKGEDRIINKTSDYKNSIYYKLFIEKLQ